MTDFYINKVAATLNKEEGRNDPTIVVWDKGHTIECRVVRLHGPAEIISDPQNPHPSGATVWVTTDASYTCA